MRYLTLALIISFLSLAAPKQVEAAADCTITATAVAFGIYDPLNTLATDSTGTVTLTCFHTGGGGTRVDWTVDLSTGGAGTYTPRQLSNGAGLISYNLFTDAARTQIWGNGLGGTGRASGRFNLSNGAPNNIRTTNLIAYGRIPALQDPAPGNYLDFITVTLTF